jgi:hypothetical protein
VPEKIPDGGLIIVRDGDPGEPEQALRRMLTVVLTDTSTGGLCVA